MLDLFYLGIAAAFLAAVLDYARGRMRPSAAADPLLRRARLERRAKRLADAANILDFEMVCATDVRAGDHILCVRDDVIIADGQVVEGTASVDESAVTGKSAPVVREPGGDQSMVIGGTTVRSGHLVVRVSVPLGARVMDRILAHTEGMPAKGAHS